MIKTSELTKDFYSSGDVAKMLGVVPMTVIGYDNKGIMKFERTITNRRVISKENLIAYLTSEGILLDDSNNCRYDAKNKCINASDYDLTFSYFKNLKQNNNRRQQEYKLFFANANNTNS